MFKRREGEKGRVDGMTWVFAIGHLMVNKRLVGRRRGCQNSGRRWGLGFLGGWGGWGWGGGGVGVVFGWGWGGGGGLWVALEPSPDGRALQVALKQNTQQVKINLL